MDVLGACHPQSSLLCWWSLRKAMEDRKQGVQASGILVQARKWPSAWSAETLELNGDLRDRWIQLRFFMGKLRCKEEAAGSLLAELSRLKVHPGKGRKMCTYALSLRISLSPALSRNHTPWPSVLCKFSQGNSLLSRGGSSFYFLYFILLLQLYLSVIDKNCMYFRCTTWFFDIHIHCEMIMDYNQANKQMNMSITSHSSFALCGENMRNRLSWQILSTQYILLTIATILYSSLQNFFIL